MAKVDSLLYNEKWRRTLSLQDIVFNLSFYSYENTRKHYDEYIIISFSKIYTKAAREIDKIFEAFFKIAPVMILTDLRCPMR